MNTNKRRLYEGLNRTGSGSGSGGDGGSTIEPGTGGTSAAVPLVSGNFGDWTPLVNPTDQYYQQQLPLRYKADLLAFPLRAIIYLEGQFGLLASFAGTNITLGSLPGNICPPHRLIKYMICQNIELYLIIETTGEVKLASKDGLNLPTMDNTKEDQPYYLECYYCPNITNIVYTAHRSASFTRNNCGNGYTGGSVVFSHDYTSSESQAAANALADANFSTAGQNFANDPANGATCTLHQFTATRTGSFTRNNCGDGYIGSTITVSRTYVSSISQDDAEAYANASFNTDGQNIANDPANGATCTLISTYTATRTGSFTRNNCGDGYTGSSVPFSRDYTSNISQDNADALAAADANFNTDGQNFANDPTNGATCTLNQVRLSGYANANDDIQAFDVHANLSEVLTSDLNVSYNLTGVLHNATTFLGGGSIVIPAGQTSAQDQGGMYTFGTEASDYSNIVVTFTFVSPNPNGGITITY